MDKISGMIQALKNVENDFDKIVIDATKLQEQLIKKMNTDNLYQGVDANNTVITPKYTSYTIAIKRRKGQPSDRVTLKDTLDFYNSFDVVFGGNEFEIIAKDIKNNSLQSKYGKNILGLTLANRNTLAAIIYPILVTEIKNRL